MSAFNPRNCAVGHGSALFKDVRPVANKVAKSLQAASVKPVAPAQAPASSDDLTTVLKTMTAGIEAMAAAIRTPARKVASAPQSAVAPASAAPVQRNTGNPPSVPLRTATQLRYVAWTTRPKGTIYTLSGLSTETNIARLFLTMSADRPLGETEYACHRCDDPLCAHPDHLMVGTHHTNVLDKLQLGRPIRERMAARFFDYQLLEIGVQSPEPSRKAAHKRRPKRIVPVYSPALVVSTGLQSVPA